MKTISFYVPAKTGNKNKATIGGGGPMNVGVVTDLVPAPCCDITGARVPTVFLHHIGARHRSKAWKEF